MYSAVDCYKEWGGAWTINKRWFKSLCISWPGANITVAKDFIRLRVGWRVCTFERSLILRLTRVGGFPFSGIRLYHQVPGVPDLVIFWTWRYKKLRAQLEQYGYSVTE